MITETKIEDGNPGQEGGIAGTDSESFDENLFYENEFERLTPTTRYRGRGL